MIDTAQVATLGLSPGCNTYNIATLGFGFEISVYLVDFYTGEQELLDLTTYPKEPELRGGGPIEVIDSRREVIVVVTFRGESYSKRLFLDAITLNNTIKIIATFLSIKKRVIEIFVEMKTRTKKGIQVMMNKIYNK